MVNRSNRLLSFVIFVVCVVACAKSTVAQDKLGVFFDEIASVDTYATTVENELVTAYVTIVSPSSVDGVESYIGTIGFVGESWWQVENYGECWLGWMPYPTLVVSCDEPLMGTEYIIVAQYTICVYSPSTQVAVFLEAFGAVYYPSGSNEEVRLSPISGDYSEPIAVINGVVGSPVESWGSIKSLYR